MSFFGSIFGGKRKHEEKMEKIKRDEQRDKNHQEVELELARHGINAHDKGSKILGGVASLVSAGAPIAGMALSGGGSSMLGGLFGNPKGGAGPVQHGGAPDQKSMLMIGGAALLLILLLKKK